MTKRGASASGTSQKRPRKKTHCEYCDTDIDNSGFRRHHTACRDKAERRKRIEEYEHERKRRRKGTLTREGPHDLPDLGELVAGPSGSSVAGPSTSIEVDVDAAILFNHPDSGAEVHLSVPSPDVSANAAQAIDSDDISSTRPLANDPSIQYDIDDIVTVYHPSSGRERKHSRFEDFKRGAQEDLQDTYKLYEQFTPWSPFRSRVDFEFAEIVLQARLSQRETDRLISLFHRCIKGEQDFTLKNHKDVQDTWKAASEQLTPFTKETISVPYKQSTRDFVVRYRSLWDWTLEQLHNPFLAPHFIFDAERLYKFNGEEFKLFIDEPWTASRWWEIQSKLPDDGKPLCYIIYADKTKLSTFGTAKGYPVVARLANLPVHIRNGEGLGGGCVVGWLPIVPEDPSEKQKTGFANFKRVVWHESFLRMLQTIAPLSKVGYVYENTQLNLLLRLFPVVIILSSDYEEQGFKGLRPCPVCLVDQKSQSDLSKTFSLCTADEVQDLLQAASEETYAEDRETRVKEQGLRNIQNAFWIVENSDPFKAVSFDRLHAYHEGLWGKHIWPELQKHIELLGREAAQSVDNQMNEMPSWKDLSHMSQVMSIKFSDGKKYEHISKVILYATHNLFHHQKNKLAYKMLKVVRAYINLDMLIALEDYKAESANDEDFASKNWEFPKAHTHKHAFNDVRAKGASRNFNSKINEKKHGPLKDAYEDVSNKQHSTYVDQILQYDEHIGASTLLRARLDYMDALVSDPEDDTEQSKAVSEESDLVLAATRTSKYTLVSKNSPVTFHALEAEHSSNSAFKNFRVKLNQFLTHTRSMAGLDAVKFRGDDEITEYKFLKINYESMVDFKQHTDYLRCNPSFRDKPRYDHVIIDTQDGPIFGKLLCLFTCKVAGEVLPLALVQPLDAPIGGVRRKDIDLEFLRLKARLREESEFFHVKSFTRGAFVVKDYESQTGRGFFAVDTVDTDMYLRLRHLIPK
ncbi:hypothetical protein K474DRAFT_1710969 [Panus rudis PR-1116 ss-1]|nr:hypothetical protein K474DRAFT_1710969 [Panus rudis PR-1116 ss-1]